MANEKNLIPLNKRSKEAQREIQEKGRKANKEKCEARKTLKEELLLLLSQGNTQNPQRSRPIPVPTRRHKAP